MLNVNQTQETILDPMCVKISKTLTLLTSVYQHYKSDSGNNIGSNVSQSHIDGDFAASVYQHLDHFSWAIVWLREQKDIRRSLEFLFSYLI